MNRKEVEQGDKKTTPSYQSGFIWTPPEHSLKQISLNIELSVFPKRKRNIILNLLFYPHRRIYCVQQFALNWNLQPLNGSKQTFSNVRGIDVSHFNKARTSNCNKRVNTEHLLYEVCTTICCHLCSIHIIYVAPTRNKTHLRALYRIKK